MQSGCLPKIYKEIAKLAAKVKHPHVTVGRGYRQNIHGRRVPKSQHTHVKSAKSHWLPGECK